MKEKHIAYWDNLKGFLILLVVFGHLLEYMPFCRQEMIYKTLYLFHMPLFVFCSGYLTHYKPAKVIDDLLLPYLVFQFLHCTVSTEPMQFTTPHWILWYLPALAVWRMTVPVLDEMKKGMRLFTLLAVFFVGYFCGFNKDITYFLSFSRILVFYPFFVLGYYTKGFFQSESPLAARIKIYTQEKKAYKWILFLCTIGGLILFAQIAPEMSYKGLYATFPYDAIPHAKIIRAFQYLAALGIGATVLAWTPKRKTWLQYLGKRSLYIYIVHAVFVPIVGAYLPVYHFSRVEKYLICAVMAIGICVLICLVTMGVSFVYRKLERKVRAWMERKFLQK